jgi:hypothetical protein
VRAFPPLLLLLAACGPSAYTRATSANTPAAYRAFLRAHPDDRDAPGARERLALLEFEIASTTHTLLAYKRFLEAFPDSSKATQAKALLETLRFTTARAQGTALTYRQFLAEHPDGAHAAEAIRLLAEVELSTVPKLDDPRALAALISSHPDDPRRAQAEARLDDVTFQRATGQGTLALLQYLADFPAGAHRDDARAELLSRQVEGLLFSGEVDSAVALVARSPLASRVPDLGWRLDRGRQARDLLHSGDPLAAAATPAHYLRDLDDVAKALHAPDALDRWEAAEELGQHVNVRAIEPLVEAIRSGRNPLVRQRALDSLAVLLASLPPRVADYEVGARVAELRARAESPEVHLSIAVLLDLGGRLEDAGPAYQRAYDPSAPDPVILRRWADVRRQRGQRYSSAVAARQLAVWAEGVAREHASAPASGEAPLPAARQLCAAVEAARFAERAIAEAAKGGTEFPEDVADFQRAAAGTRQLAEARLRDAELALRTADARALTCDDARVTERLAAGQKDRERALRALRTERPKVARALLQLAAARDPSPAVRQAAAAELGALRE